MHSTGPIRITWYSPAGIAFLIVNTKKARINHVAEHVGALVNLYFVLCYILSYMAVNFGCHGGIINFASGSEVLFGLLVNPE